MNLAEYKAAAEAHKKGSKLEAKLLNHIRLAGIPEPQIEHRFHPVRLWRFDFAWPDQMIAVEVEGGTFAKGKSRHTTGSGFHNDCIKYNSAAILGWRVLKFDTKLIASGEALVTLKEAMDASNSH